MRAVVRRSFVNLQRPRGLPAGAYASRRAISELLHRDRPSSDKAPGSPEAHREAQQLLWRLAQGNKAFEKRVSEDNLEVPVASVENFMLDPLNPDPIRSKTKALVVFCSHISAAATQIFGAEHGELRMLRASGNAIVTTGILDGFLASVEKAIADAHMPLIVVMGNSDNFVVEAAVRCVMTENGRSAESSSVSPNILHAGLKDEEMALIKAVLPAARDAYRQKPGATFEELCETACKLNVWKTVEAIMTSCPQVHEKIRGGIVFAHGAYMNTATGHVTFMGEHPSKMAILSRPPTAHVVRTATAPVVPADEAFAALFTGNKCFSMGLRQSSSISAATLSQLEKGGQSPFAVVLGCADSRAPPEILFDVRPGDLFVLRNAGNICSEDQGTIIGSAEYAVMVLGAKLIVVLGHTQCGAVTAAVDAVRRRRAYTRYAGSIGNVLENIDRESKEAVSRMPEADFSSQLQLATKLNVFASIEKMIQNSSVIRDGVENLEIQIHGGVYDLGTGTVEWLGQHRSLEGLVDQSLPLYNWKTSPYRFADYKVASRGCETLKKLYEGNQRFVHGKLRGTKLLSVLKEVQPHSIVVASGQARVPIDLVFDAEHGEIVSQRCSGNIAGHPSGTLGASLEYSVAHFAPKVLLVLGETNSDIIRGATSLAAGEEPDEDFNPTRLELRQVGVGAVRAVQQVEEADVRTSAGKGMEIMRLATELNVLYTIERLLGGNAVVRNAVKYDGLQVHGALLDKNTGEVQFFGPHPMQDELLKDEGWLMPLLCTTSQDAPVP
eukprot:TRINITY_DN120949_c0_g1_i1.p1 TRINITY_DN120949_c0_g1~~TRINITY_DN120949_c0_g1_i1.p1  ORF type:complete len:799 (+),score=220.48 TRINITY_DN120949_c0_g1_i1:59-2398(+)